MKSSPRRAFDVFDFKEEDELPELASGKYLGKFKNPNLDNHAMLKYEFLECAVQGANVGRKEVDCVPCVDVDATDCGLTCDIADSCCLLGAEEENFTQKEELCVLDTALHSSSVSHEQPFSILDTKKFRNLDSDLERIDSSLEASPPGKGQINYDLLKSPSSNEPVDVVSEADESMNGNTASSPTSEMADDGVSLNGYASDHCFGNVEMDDINMEVVLCLDYVIYRDIYCTAALLTFSHNCIKISGSNPHGSEDIFDFEWGIDDLIDIRCQWMERVETVFIEIRRIVEDADQRISGIEELKMAVVDPNWSHKQQVITSLNMKYSAVWDVMVDTDLGIAGDDLRGQSHYFPNFDESFEEVVYPKGDSDAVSISKRDVDLLQPETFINDTIIDFYIKYLKNQIQPEDKHRFHFFNSFFFRKLADMDKDPTSASDGRAAFLRVRKWTRKVNIFEKDYIFIPINFNLHWSLIVICHPGEVARLKDDNLEKSPKVPCILHMDSIKGSHTGIKNLVQSYLWEEWNEREKETQEDISSKFLNLRFVSLELNANWFSPAEASLKRTIIQRLIYDILKSRSPEVSSAACSDEDEPSEIPVKNKNETCVEFLSKRCNPSIVYHGNKSSCQAGPGIEMTLLSASSMSSQCANNSGLVLTEFLESGATAGLLLGQYPSCDHPSSYYHLNGSISTSEDGVENSDPFVFLPSDEAGLRQMAGITPPARSNPYSPRACRGEASYNLGISVQEEHGNLDSSSETSNFAADDSDVDIIGTFPVGGNVGTSHKDETDEQTSPSAESTECLTGSPKLLGVSVVEGSQDPDKMHNSYGDGDQLPTQLLDVDVIDDSDMDITGNSSVGENVGTSQKEETDKQRSPSAENMECLTGSLASAASKLLDVSVVEGSKDPDKMLKIYGDGDQLPTHQEISISLHQDPDIIDNTAVACDNVLVTGDDQVAESYGQRAAKRLRLAPPHVAGDTMLMTGDNQVAE
ncbi:probable ubiquitin-like-specific protease 2B isoform X4 [Juglans microcarpa x Juglans regia]|uniref:probable ubiquitin-like-specific protease 2B isoform X4 n=1 Tax=Juglans microcarpa x Juglans regia TaxID=2249226 RepID=UPI001B7E86C3|nr:probable ubiquitin-like-specific protease 2B isoform X4 [Juglans microcarpa x Juglans regia]